MATIAEENKKILREPMRVFCGVSIALDQVESVTIQGGSYDGRAGDTSTPGPVPVYMDLSGDGFANDGAAVPLEEDHAGIVSGLEPLSLRVTLEDGWGVHVITATGSEDGIAKTWRFNSGRILIPGNGRKIINEIVAGYAWAFDNTSLVACTVQLRGIETACDNPALQMSEIEIKGWEPEDMTAALSEIGEDYPIWYTAGYVGDMAQTRRFYLDGQITWADKIITIKGTDATRYLDKEYSGAYLGNTASEQTGGYNKLFDKYDEIITAAGVAHDYRNELANNADFSQTLSQAILLQKQSVREMIAQASNLFKFDLSRSRPGFACNLNYRDAGRPELYITQGTAEPVETIESAGDLEVTAEPQIKQIRMNAPLTYVEASAAIKTDNIRGTVFEDTSDPYYNFTASAGTITKLGPWAYKVKSTSARSITVSGRKITIYDPSETEAYSPYIFNARSKIWTLRTVQNGKTIELPDFYGLEDWESPGAEDVYDMLYAIFSSMSNVSPLSYKFRWRGNPHLQPRDHINVIIDGQPVPMTIDTVTLEHERGGLISQITARGGFI